MNAHARSVPSGRSEGTDSDLAMMVRLAGIVSEILAEPQEHEAIPRSIVSKAIAFVPGCDAAAVTQRERSKLVLAAATDDRAAACVELELVLGHGPTPTAAWHSEVSVAEAVERDVRWPEWAGGVTGHGFSSVLALRLAVGSERLGALTVFSTAPHEWTPRELSLAMAFATHASTAMHTAKLEGTVHFTVEARHRIGVAQGILMQRYDVSEEAAFSMLQRYSNATNIKVRDLAVRVIQRRDLPPILARPTGTDGPPRRQA
jgi:GAF domain-containing protein